MFRFFRAMIAFRRSHPPLAPARFWREGVRWYGRAGASDLDSRELAFVLQTVDGAALYVMVNTHWEARTFTILEGEGWRRAVDTALDSPHDIVAAGAEPLLEQPVYWVDGRSIVVLVAAGDGPTSSRSQRAGRPAGPPR